MKVAGIICEYNPFHNGHLYQLEQTQKNATHIVCAMSGNYVQRGDMAIVDKWARAKAAVLCGADLVIELPTPWACSSAENFAACGVYLLSALKTDMLSFGCETDNVKILEKAALAVDSSEIGTHIKGEMSRGLTYPAALRKAVCTLCGEEIAAVLDEPNNTLAVEYIRQSKKMNIAFEYLSIKRSGSKHSDENPFNSYIASAAALRRLENVNELENFIPSAMLEGLTLREREGLYPQRVENAERVILSFLRQMSQEEMWAFISDENGLAMRLYRASRNATSFDELIKAVKVKSITLAAVRRAVFSCFLKIPADIAKKTPPYVKVLAMNKKGAEIIKNSNCVLPIISRYSQVSSLSDYGKKIYSLECSCTDLYSLFSKKISGCSREQTSPIFVID